MNEDEIKELITKDGRLQSFIQDDYGKIEMSVGGIPMVIFKESTGASYYYQLPYDEKYDYDRVTRFMRIAIPVLSDLIIKEREKYLNH